MGAMGKRFLFARVLRGRGSLLVVILTLMFLGLPGQPASFSGMAAAAGTSDTGIALWANSSGGSGGLVLSASSSTANGLVHSNRDLKISGSRNLLLGGTEYGRRLQLKGHKNVINPPAAKVAPGGSPIEFDIGDYRPGGAAAVAAGQEYFDATSECELEGKWKRHGSGVEIPSGLHYVPCDVVISGADITGSFTIVAEGTIRVAGAGATMGPGFAGDLLFFSNAARGNAIWIAGEGSTFDGFLYAPRGTSTLAGASHDLRCGMVANKVALKGSGHEVAGDPTCGAATGNAAPVAADDAYTTDEDSLLEVAAPGVLGNDFDPDVDPLTAVLVSDVSDGTLTLGADGSLTYAPDPGFFGSDAFTYVASDGVADSNVATVSITVVSVNDAPVADAGGPYSALVGELVVFEGSGSFDLDGTIVTYEWDFGDGSTGSGVAPDHAYSSAGLYVVSLTVTDDGGLSDTATSSADIAEVPNAAPVAADDAYSTDEDSLLEVAAPGVLGNDVDPDLDPLTAVLVSDVSDGTLTLNADGSFTLCACP